MPSLPVTGVRWILLAALALLISPAAARAADPAVGHTVKHIVVPGAARGRAAPGRRAPLVSRAEHDRTGEDGLHVLAVRQGRCRAPWAPLSWSIEAASAYEGAALDTSRGPYAPIVFSHGASNDPFDYADTLEAIARAGFIVAAPAHTNNTQDDVRLDYINALARTRLFSCQDGLPARAVPTLSGPGFPGNDCSKASVPDSMSDRSRDVAAVLDNLSGWFPVMRSTSSARG